jgi:uncharacterized membrane protein
MINAIAIALHVLAAVLWVGGLFFSYIVLRPTLTAIDPPDRLMIWAGIFKRFFPWVWLSVLVLLTTGYWMIFSWFNGFAQAPMYVHIMHLLGLLMMVLFIYLFYRVYPIFKTHIANENWPEAGAVLNRIRHIVLVNLVLGLILLIAVTAMQRIG